jgi:gamma-glutamyltranspeptidase/glutathione hydrolase
MTHLARRRLAVVGAGATSLALALSGAAVSGLTAGATAAERTPHDSPQTPTSRGFGGAVTSVDPEASRIGIKVLKRGGNAVDAAVATAAALGVTEPYSAGIGGGGYFVYYDAKNKRVYTIDGRETAPDTMSHDAFIDPATGEPTTSPPSG